MSLKIESAEFLVDSCYPVLAVVIDGKTVSFSADSQKPYILDAGLIVVPGLKMLGVAEVVEDVPVGPMGGSVRSCGCVRDARLVALFRRFLEAVKTYPWPIGPMDV